MPSYCYLFTSLLSQPVEELEIGLSRACRISVLYITYRSIDDPGHMPYQSNVGYGISLFKEQICKCLREVPMLQNGSAAVLAEFPSPKKMTLLLQLIMPLLLLLIMPLLLQLIMALLLRLYLLT